MNQRALASATTGLVLMTAASMFGCSAKSSATPSGTGGRAATGANGGSSGSAAGGRVVIAPGTGGSGIGLSSGGSMSSAGGSGIQACVSKGTGAEPTPLDIYILLDISLSMVEQTGSGGSKWDAVKRAITAFLQDKSSEGISVGIQYFPLRKPGVPAQCTTDAQCGAGGPCTLKWCSKYSASVPNGIAACTTDTECSTIPTLIDYGTCSAGACTKDATKVCATDPDCRMTTPFNFGPCAAFGHCSSAPDVACANLNTACGPDAAGKDRGMCAATTSSFCFHGTECSQATYAAPAVEIQPLPAAAPALLSSLDAQVPDGDTPTGPALRGAIAHARDWANSHPGRTVVAVLATDGLPTECLPDNVSFTRTTPLDRLVSEVAAVAAFGVQGAPSIPTFVIGVFAGSDAQAPANLERMAVAGGTAKAQIVDTAGDVTQQFLTALNAVRASRLACEFQIPQPTDGAKLNYFEVNVAHRQGSDAVPLFYVTTPDRCDPVSGGWYYDDLRGEAPSKILVCPQTCTAFQNTTGSLEIQLGCATVVK